MKKYRRLSQERLGLSAQRLKMTEKVLQALFCLNAQRREERRVHLQYVKESLLFQHELLGKIEEYIFWKKQGSGHVGYASGSV